MNHDIKARWVEALRSGEYEQGVEVLRNRRGQYCCLGVLCDISGRGDWLPRNPYAYSYCGVIGALPDSVMHWAQLKSADPHIGKFDRTLSNLNDRGLSFEDIADIIEEHL
jgi:hypothetical protein